jgi:hypothetical protein
MGAGLQRVLGASKAKAPPHPFRYRSPSGKIDDPEGSLFTGPSGHPLPF